jgi:DNA repair exonuclease SbcCD ATPase subunit
VGAQGHAADDATAARPAQRRPTPANAGAPSPSPRAARAAEGEDAAQFFVVQSRLDNNNRRKEKLEAEIESLERTRERLDGTVKQLKALSFDRARSQSALERLLSKLPKSAGRGAAFDIKSASDELLQLVLPPLVRRSPRPPGDPLADHLLAGLEAPESIPFSPPLEVAESDLRRHLEALSRNAAAARDTAAEALGGADRIPPLLTALERTAAAARAGRQAEAQGYLERIEGGLKARRSELAKLGEDIQQLGAQLASRGARDHYLTYAIFAMIVRRRHHQRAGVAYYPSPPSSAPRLGLSNHRTLICTAETFFARAATLLALPG